MNSDDLWIYPLPDQMIPGFLPIDDEGTVFPASMHFAIGFVEPGSHSFHVVVEVEDGQPVVSYVGIERDGKTKAPPITGSGLHQMPFGTILKTVIDYATGFAQMAVHNFPRVRPYFYADEAGNFDSPAVFDRPYGLMSVRIAAAGPQHGRRVSNITLQRVAEIVRTNGFNPRDDIMRELHVSPRTATRYIAQARQRGMLDTTNQED